MLIDIMNCTIDLKDKNLNSEQGYFVIMSLYSAEWNLIRYYSESQEHAGETKGSLEYIEQNYPYIWDVLKRRLTADNIFDNVSVAMDKLVDEMMSKNRGRRGSRDEFVRKLEEAYERTLKKELG